ncbi:MAG TPA: hypothetical protein VMT52_05300 [Planctomycetota bacterium]|nr:hypothetical protein [Planctomycetota bacterium]
MPAFFVFSACCDQKQLSLEDERVCCAAVVFRAAVGFRAAVVFRVTVVLVPTALRRAALEERLLRLEAFRAVLVPRAVLPEIDDDRRALFCLV